MSVQSWQETFVSQTAAGTSFGAFTTAKTILPTSCLFTLPANFFSVGKVLRITAYGNLSNIVTTPGTVVFQVKLGSVVAFTTGTMQLSTTAHVALPFKLEILLTCRSIGSGTSATLMGQGVMTSQCVAASAVADDTYTHAVLMAPNTTPAVGTGFDSSSAQQVDLFCGFSINDAANAVQLQQYIIESLN